MCTLLGPRPSILITQPHCILNQVKANFDLSNQTTPTFATSPPNLRMSAFDYAYSEHAESSGTSDTSDAPNTVNVANPDELSKKDPMKWSQDNVQTFL